MSKNHQSLEKGYGLDWMPTTELDEMISADTDASGYFHLKWYGCSRSGVRKCLDGIARTIRSTTKQYQFIQHSTSLFFINHANYLFQERSYEVSMPVLLDWDFVDMYDNIFCVCFEPVKPLGETIHRTMTNLGLNEGKYVSVHLRTRYPD